MSYYTIDATTPSKNYSSREGSAITMLVIHATAGSFASALQELRDPKPQAPGKRVSAHYLISKTGHIAQLVPDAQAAWHAGVSSWRGVTNINACSIGIELENANTGADPYPPIQIDALIWLSRILVAQYAIVQEMVVRHLDIAPKRKTDPAGFPWLVFMNSLFPPPAVLHTVTAGKAGAIAQEDRRPGALAARYYTPGTPIVCDDLTTSYWHVADGSGFIPVGQVQA